MAGLIDMKLRGAEKFVRAAAAVHELADRDLVSALAGRMHEVIKPISDAVLADIPRKLPSGFRSTLLATMRTTGTVASSYNRVSLKLKGRAHGRRRDRDVAAMDRGVLRHPIYGHRSRWATTSVQPGFFTEAVKHSEPLIHDELDKAITEAINEVERKV